MGKCPRNVPCFVWRIQAIIVIVALICNAALRAEEQAGRVSFQHDVLAALSRHSCSSGACHGSPTGKGGFRLSLRGFDADLDAGTLIREDFSRRVNRLRPEESLLLAKPLMTTPHGGGRRLTKGDPAYKILRDWIAQGCQPDSAGAPRCVGIEVTPRVREFPTPLVAEQLAVTARFSDGGQRDVTHLAVFSSSDEEVAAVSPTGQVSGKQRGEATILVRYLDHLDTAAYTLLGEAPGFVWPNPPARNYIDEQVFAKLRKLQIPPAELCSDQEFVRRVFLDLIGLLPTPAEAASFTANTDPHKRDQLIDALLERPEYADFWALLWADLLRVKSGRLGAPAAFKLHRWLVASVAKNRPYDAIARDLLAASGGTLANPPANFYRAAGDANDCGETIAQLFLGIRIQCAKCHNHPFDRWSQQNYLGLGAFFARVGRKPSASADEIFVYSLPQGEALHPRTGKPAPPWLPGIDVAARSQPDEDRRLLLARLLATGENRQFAEVAANRIWARAMGRGIVDPVDDFRPSNPPSHGPLLAALADDFVRGGFDQKQLLRTILRSRVYQLSGQTNPLNRRDEKYFSHARSRLLTAEQLLDALCQVTESPESFLGLPAGTRAGQIPSPELGGHFLSVFGKPARDTACECERGGEPKLTHSLQLISGDLIGEKLAAPHSRLSRLLHDAPDRKSPELAAVVTEFYYAALSRPPQADELLAAVQYVQDAPDKRSGLEDVVWALLNSKEFLFQH